jgi:hypothetical protein
MAVYEITISQCVDVLAKSRADCMVNSDQGFVWDRKYSEVPEKDEIQKSCMPSYCILHEIKEPSECYKITTPTQFYWQSILNNGTGYCVSTEYGDAYGLQQKCKTFGNKSIFYAGRHFYLGKFEDKESCEAETYCDKW